MYPWTSLPHALLALDGEISSAFGGYGLIDYRSAARHVSRLPYGRNRDALDPFCVLREGCGTCSTKHALLRRLAQEQNVEVRLALGIFEMDASNTPRVRLVLQKHGLISLPEAHCYLRTPDCRVDLTGGEAAPSKFLTLLHEEEITPEQIGQYKVARHRSFMKRWMEANGGAGDRSLEQMWQIREDCIQSLCGESNPV